MDTNLYSFYKNDLASGELESADDAVELLSCLFLKLFQLNKIFTFDNQKSFSGYQLFQNITIGGQDKNGHDATNELSYLVPVSYTHLDVYKRQPITIALF